MAKSKFLSRVLLGFALCLCMGIGGNSVMGCKEQLNDGSCNVNYHSCCETDRSYKKKSYGIQQHDAMELRNYVKTIYDSQIGVHEATGHNDGPQVEAYLSYTGLGKGNAWCAAFVCWVLGQAGVENPKAAWAASLFPKNRLVWPRAKLRTTGNSQLTTIKGSRATIFGLYFPSLKRIAHCGFIDEWGEKEVITVEGNTNDNGSREGDGIYRKRRPIKSLYAVADWIGKEKQP